MSTDPKLLSEVVALARRAGDSILSVYGQQFEVTNKRPIAAHVADTKSHEIIVHALQALTPAVPVLSKQPVIFL